MPLKIKFNQSGFAHIILLGIIVAVLLLAGGGYYLYSKGKLPTLNSITGNSQKSADKSGYEPKPDLAHAAVKKIEAKKGGSVKLITLDKIVVSLEIPAGALKKDQEVKLVPLFTDVKDKNPMMGVVISPADLAFQKPVTLSFEFSETPYHSDGPKDWEAEKSRVGGKAQVLIYDQDKKTFTPTLVARAVETETYLPSRVLAAGYYIATLDGKDQQKYSTDALSIEKLSSVSTLETATALLSSGQKLTDAQKKKANSAVEKVLGKKGPPVMEMYASLALQKKLASASTGFLVKTAYAATLNKEFFTKSCSSKGLSTIEYQTLFHMSLLSGFESESGPCLEAAKKRAAEVSEEILKTGEVEPANALSQAHKVSALKLTDLNSKLKDKAKTTVKAQAEKTLKKPKPNAAELARSLQKMDSVGLEKDSTRSQLASKFKETTNSTKPSKGSKSSNAKSTNSPEKTAMPSVSTEESSASATPFPLPSGGLTASQLGYQAAMDAALVGFTNASLTVGLNSPDLSGVEQMVDKVADDSQSFDDNPVAFCMFMGIDGLPQICTNYTSTVNNTIHEYDTQEDKIEQTQGEDSVTENYETEFVDNYSDSETSGDYYIDDYGSDSYESYEDFTNYYSDYDYSYWFDWNAYYTDPDYFNPTGEDYSPAGDDSYTDDSANSTDDYSSSSEEIPTDDSGRPLYGEGAEGYTPI